jgi:hypothetical protein
VGTLTAECSGYLHVLGVHSFSSLAPPYLA